MLYFMDTEFIEAPSTIDLISIGVVAEDGREFYAESSETDWTKASTWVMDNVYPHLKRGETQMKRAEIRDGLNAFIHDDKPEIWGYYADYDWVVFCWLFGSMIDLPTRFPKWCRDIKQAAWTLGDPRLPRQESTEHNALEDARWNKQAYEFLLESQFSMIRARSGGLRA